MKIRSGFVSNSSSSSFICNVCGGVESGYDMSLSEAEMYECENGHTICERHIKEVSQEIMQEILKKQIDEARKYAVSKDEEARIDKFVEDEGLLTRKITLDDVNYFCDEFDIENLRYYLPSELCPICNMEVIEESYVLNYIEKTRSISKEEIKKEMRDKFGSAKKMREFLKG